MQVYQIMATYQSDRWGSTFGSHVWTDNTVYSDRLAAEMAVDLLNLLREEDNGAVFDMGLHGNDEPIEYYLQEFTA